MITFKRSRKGSSRPRAIRWVLAAVAAVVLAVPLGLAVAEPGQGVATQTLTPEEEQVFEKNVVRGLDPANTTVTLFDYDNGRTNDDTGDLNGPGSNASASSVYDWWFGGKDGQNINSGRLLTFGTGMNRFMGYWNQGSGSGQGLFSYNNPGFPFIVSPTLTDGQPSLSARLDPAGSVLVGYDGAPSVYAGARRGTAGEGNLIFANAGSKNISNGVQYLAGHEGASSSDAAWIQGGGGSFEGGSLPVERLSLGYLFDSSAQPGKTRYENVTGLFQLDDDGYYYYDMRDNYAEFVEDDKTEGSSGHFTLYDKPAVTRTDSTDSIGGFFPFDPATEVFDVSDGELVSDAHADNTGQNLNHHLGMTVETSFRQPSNGTIGDSDKHMTFEFSGDDDVWVFIDDVLVLDLGGIHSELFGTIDFATGEVLLGPSYDTKGIPEDPGNYAVRRTTIRRMFEYAQDPDNAADPYQTRSYTYNVDGYAIQDAEWSDWTGTSPGSSDTTVIDGARFRGETFASDTGHTLKMFYLERGNYDSSLSLKFNFQPELYQEIKKVDQYGNPLAGATFDLYSAMPAEGTVDVASAATYDGELKTTLLLSGISTDENGIAQFKEGQGGDPVNFSDRYNPDSGDGLLYVLRETSPPEGYKSLVTDIVLSYNPQTNQFKVNNRYQTGAYAGFNVLVTGQPNGIYCGDFDQDGGLVTKPDDDASPLPAEEQKAGLLLAVPMLKQGTGGTWLPLYGDNLGGFDSVEYTRADDYDERRVQIRKVTLEAALRQSALYAEGNGAQPWFLGWDDETGRIAGTLYDLPGRSDRYIQVNDNGDMRMLYAFIDAEGIAAVIGRTSDDDVKAMTPVERYKALGEAAKAAVDGGTLDGLLEKTGYQNADQEDRTYSTVDIQAFIRDYRSIINVPNEVRQLRVMKVDQNGVPVNGAEFSLYENPGCSGDPVASGTTATVDGQDGMLVFDRNGDGSDGHAEMKWPDTPAGTTNEAMATYYLKETGVPESYELNETVVPVKVGFYSIYADAGGKDDGVTVMAGVGKLTQTMVKYTKGDVNITLRNIIATGQSKPSGEWSGDWADMTLPDSGDPAQPRTLNLVYGQNALVDYGLSDEDGGRLVRPFFVTDEGYVRASVKQDTEAVRQESEKTGTNFDGIEGQDITGLFSLLNVVVVTDRQTDPDPTGTLEVSKTLTGGNLVAADYTKPFKFTFEFTDSEGEPVEEAVYHFIGRDEWGSVGNGGELQLHHGDSIQILGLPVGTRYKVTEQSADGFYTVTPYTSVHEGVVELGEGGGEVFSAPFVNAKGAPTLRLVKTDRGTGEPVAGVTFSLYRLGIDGAATGDPLETGTTGDDGSIAFTHDFSNDMTDDAPNPRYVLREQAPAAGYAALAADIVLEYDGGTKGLAVANPLECGAQAVAGEDDSDDAPLVTVSNAPLRLDVLKVDQTGNGLDGVTFSLYGNAEATGDPVASRTTATVDGQAGVASFEGVEWPDVSDGPVIWSLKETAADGLAGADAYKLNETVVPVVIDGTGVYADAGTAADGVDVLAGPGGLTQGFVDQAADEGSPLHRVTATAQTQSADFSVDGWKDGDEPATLDLAFSKDASPFGHWKLAGDDEGLPLLSASTGFIRARVTGSDGASVGGAVSPVNVVRVTNVCVADLSVSKTVLPAEGTELSDAQKAAKFTFDVHVTVPEAWMLPKELGVSVRTGDGEPETSAVEVEADSENPATGTFGLTLTHGQTAVVAGLPVGTEVVVAEGDTPGYEASERELSGTVGTDGCDLAFENRVVWPQLAIEKTQSVDGPEAFTADPLDVVGGQTVTYRLTVTNDGDDAARNVVVIDTVPQAPVEPEGAAGPALAYVKDSAKVVDADGEASYDDDAKTVTWSLGDIPAGEARTVEFQVRVPAPQVTGTTRWLNVGAASYDNNPDGNEPLESDEVEVRTTVPVGDIYVSKALVAGDGRVSEFLAQTEFRFTASFTSDGALLPSDVKAVRVGADGTEFEETVALGGDAGQAKATFSLRSGEALTLSGLAEGTKYKVEEAAQWGFEADTPSFEGAVGAGDMPVRLAFENRLADPGLEIVKAQRLGDEGEFTEGPLTAAHGDVVTYRLTVTNNTGVAAEGVTVTDTVPQAPVEPEGAAGPALAYVKDSAKVVDADGEASYDDDAKTVTWSLGDIPAGEARTVEFQVRVPWVGAAAAWENVGAARYANNPHGPDTDVPSNTVRVETGLGTGDLAVSKTVEDHDGGEPSEDQRAVEFTFTVTLAHGRAVLPARVTVDYASVDGAVRTETVALGDYTQMGGTVPLALSHGQTATIKGLPDGTVYTVIEEPAEGFEAETDKESGSMGLSGARVDFVNKALPPDEPEPQLGSLAVSKTVAGAATDDDRAHAFEFALSLADGEGRPLEGEFPATMADGSAGTVSNGEKLLIAHGQRVTVTGLPAGTRYTVTEEPVEGFEAVNVGESGTVVADHESTAAFVNVREPVEPDPEVPVGDVAVSKTVDPSTAGEGDLDRTFPFTLHLSDGEGAPFEDTVDAELVDGSAVTRLSLRDGGAFELSHGQVLLIHGLPVGTRYGVTEEAVEGFTTPDPTLEGTVGEGGSTGSLAFVNHRIAPPSLKVEKAQALVVDGATSEPTADGLQVPEGATVEYRVTATNTGEAAAEGVEVSDDIPATATRTVTDGTGRPVSGTEALPLAYVDGSASDGGVFRGADGDAAARVTWDLGTLGGGESRTVSFRVKLPVPSDPATPEESGAVWSWRNVAVARYANNPDNPGDPSEPPADIPSNPVDVEEGEPRPLVEIHKHQQVKGSDAGFSQDGADSPLPVDPGDTVVYRLRVTNNGAGAAPDVVVTDPLPAGLEYVDGTVGNGGTYDPASRTLTWHLGELGPHGTVDLTFEVHVPTVTGATAWYNVATADHGSPDDPSTRVEVPPSEDVYVDTDVAHLTLRKEQSLVGGGFTADPVTGECGGLLTYRLAVTNDGMAAARGVTVTDTVPQTPVDSSGSQGPALEYVEGSAGIAGSSEEGSFDAATGTVAWNVGDLRPGQTAFVHFSVRLPEVAAGTKATWENVGVARYENDPAGPGTDIPSNPVRVTVEREPDVPVPPVPGTGSLAVTKTVEGGDADDRGEVFVFDLTLTDAEGGPLDGSFPWERSDGASGAVGSGETLELTHGQVVVVTGLPEGARWRVSEREAEGFTAQEPSLEGEVAADGVAVAPFVNVVDEEPVVPDDPKPDDPDPEGPTPDESRPDEPEAPKTPADAPREQVGERFRAQGGATLLAVTGDMGSPVVWLVVAAVAVAVAVGAVVRRRDR